MKRVTLIHILVSAGLAMTAASGQAQSVQGVRLGVLKVSLEEVDAAYKQSDARCSQAAENLNRYIGPIDRVMAPRDNACAVFASEGTRTAEWRDCSNSFFADYEKGRASYRTCLAEQDRLGGERLALHRDIFAVEQEMRDGALVGADGVLALAGMAGWLGVEAGNVSKRRAADLGLSSRDGAYVKGTKEGSPAQKAGIRKGDVILRIGRSPIGGKADLSKVSDRFKAGQVLNVDFVRGGERQTIYMAIEARPIR